MIEVVDLVKCYRKAPRNAVDGISFGVDAGEFFALLGPNGAGKTPTISILTTTLLPTGGGATIAGHDLVTEASAVRRLVGIIFQRPRRRDVGRPARGKGHDHADRPRGEGLRAGGQWTEYSGAESGDKHGAA